MQKILILGANSAIAKATARIWASRGAKLYLVGRSEKKLSALIQDLKARGNPNVFGETLDLTNSVHHDSLIARAKHQLEGIDIAFIAHGVLGDQKTAERSWEASREILDVNFLSPASLCTRLANDFEANKNGHLCVITSVAGDRGRASNYVYGTAKGALSIFLSGLRNRLSAANVPVTDLRLGFVDTPMTESYPKGPLWASPETVAKGITKAIERKKDLVYLPWFWCWIMMIIRNIPEKIFKKLKI
jgi:decaprenylphospho-beta-D-erythro-pentofuranosid-2-ulose 2-reductase